VLCHVRIRRKEGIAKGGTCEVEAEVSVHVSWDICDISVNDVSMWECEVVSAAGAESCVMLLACFRQRLCGIRRAISDKVKRSEDIE
jgi:hypothetical protein